MTRAMMNPFNRCLLFLSLALWCVPYAAGSVEELTDVEAKWPGPVFLHRTTPGRTVSRPDPERLGDELPVSWLHHPAQSRGLSPALKGGPAVQSEGSGRIKRLSQSLDEGGMAYDTAAHGDYCYVGTSGSLAVFDVSDPKAPVSVHEIDEAVRALDHEGTILTAVMGCKGELVLFDLSLPSSPVEISRLLPPEGFYFERLSVSDSMVAVIGAGNLEPFGFCAVMQVIDISDPYSPEVESTLLGLSDIYADVLIQQDTIYLAIPYEGVVIFDISDPMWIEEIGFPEVFLYVQGMDCQNGYLYLAGNGLEVVDVSDPSNPEVVSQLGGAYKRDVRVSDNIAYLADDDDLTLSVVDVSDPFNPHEISTLPAMGNVYRLDLQNDTVYMPDMVYGLLIVDVSTPTAPQVESTTFTGLHPQAVDVEGGLAAVTANLAMMYTLDVTDPFAPEVQGIYVQDPDTKPDNTLRQIGVDLEGGVAVTSHWFWGMHTYDVGNPAAPDRVGELKIGDGYGFNPVVKDGDLVYTGSTGLEVIDISDPANPVKVATGPNVQEYIMDIRISGTIGYVAGYRDLVIIDLSNPLSPLELTRITFSEDAIKCIAVEDGLLGLFRETSYFLPYFSSSFELYDVSNPASPTLLDTLDNPLPVTYCWPGGPTMAVHDGRFFICCQEQLLAIDAQDPENLSLAAVYPESPCCKRPPYFSEGIRARNGLIYMAGHHGLEILRYLDVGVFLYPESTPVKVSQGESFAYEMKVENFTGKSQTVCAWIDAGLPGGGASGLLAAPFWITLEPGQNVNYLRHQQVPSTTPLGTYFLNARLIAYPDAFLDDDRIYFEVIP